MIVVNVVQISVVLLEQDQQIHIVTYQVFQYLGVCLTEIETIRSSVDSMAKYSLIVSSLSQATSSNTNITKHGCTEMQRIFNRIERIYCKHHTSRKLSVCSCEVVWFVAADCKCPPREEESPARRSQSADGRVGPGWFKSRASVLVQPVVSLERLGPAFSAKRKKGVPVGEAYHGLDEGGVIRVWSRGT